MPGASQSLKNVIVVGGSFVGRAAAQELARVVPATHRIILLEAHSHFGHLFTFPRFAIVPGYEHKAFIPYSGIFSSVPNPASHAVVQARVLSVKPRHVTLDREWQGSKEIPFEYLTVATGTLLAPPAGMENDDKPSSVGYLKRHQEQVKRAKSILIVGGGAVGVQMATDLGEWYPDKQVTVVQSRPRVMPQFHEKLHELVKKRFGELDVSLITGSRVVVPPEGFPSNGESFEVQLTNGEKVSTELVILATGQSPNNGLVKTLAPTKTESIVNQANGYIRIRPTMQFANEEYSHLFAVGDIADTGAQKAARPGVAQATVVAKNIQALIEGRSAEEKYVPGPGAIHLTLGMKLSVIFRNPDKSQGQTEPTIIEKDDGRVDMNVEAMWQRLGVVNESQDYHL